MANQIAFFKADGTIKVVDHPGPERMNHAAFEKDFAAELENCFRIVVNGWVYTYSYDVINGKVKL